MAEEQSLGRSTRLAEDSPAAWFVMLEVARKTDDAGLAAKAHRELERLGVKVTYRATPSQPGKGEAVARE